MLMLNNANDTAQGLIAVLGLRRAQQEIRSILYCAEASTRKRATICFWRDVEALLRLEQTSDEDC